MGRQPRTRARHSGAVSIGRLAQHITAPIFSRHGMGHGEIAHAWTEIVGTDLAAFCQPERLIAPQANKTACLVVRAQGARAVEVHYASLKIVEGVNSLYGYTVIERIRVVQAPPGTPPRQPDARQKPPPGGDAASPTGFAGIATPALGTALSRLERGLAARLKS